MRKVITRYPHQLLITIISFFVMIISIIGAIIFMCNKKWEVVAVMSLAFLLALFEILRINHRGVFYVITDEGIAHGKIFYRWEAVKIAFTLLEGGRSIGFPFFNFDSRYLDKRDLDSTIYPFAIKLNKRRIEFILSFYKQPVQFFPIQVQSVKYYNIKFLVNIVVKHNQMFEKEIKNFSDYT